MADPEPIPALRRALRRWYLRHRRDLPWRVEAGDRPDPYHVLLSETMLQQTQVATATAYFERFIEAIPDLPALAGASRQQVLRLWEGLGYYRRADYLHQAAAAILEHHGGQVPREVEQLMTLPGVGRSTAGAISSIAYDRRAPILDANVARVLARFFAIADPINKTATRRQLWKLADQVLPPTRSGDFNQALMDLGATICMPRGPRCGHCPLHRHCAAHRSNHTDRLPVTVPRRPPKAVTHRIVAVRKQDHLLFEQRGNSGLWAGMWQLPTAENVEAAELRRWMRRHLGMEVEQLNRLTSFGHQTTHRSICFELWNAAHKQGSLRAGAGRWCRPSAVEELPMANPQRRALALVSGR